MFSYYGSKSKIVDCYPKPKCANIIEPFAGSARYSLKYFENDVTICDIDSNIIRIWKHLQNCNENDILKLPILTKGDFLTNYKFLSEDEKLLIGYIIGTGSHIPRNKVSKQASEKHRIFKQYSNISKQLFKIKHWEIKNISFDQLPNISATWFIDPPYQFGGEWYRHSNKKIDYTYLSHWCYERFGQVIVCENTKANWLDFKPMIKMRGSNHVTTEAIWSNIPTSFNYTQMTIL